MRFVTKETEQEYTEFLENHERCNFQQSLEWGKVKTNWIKEVVLAEDESHKIIGSICVWIRKMPIFGNMMYASRGPVCDIHNEDVLNQLTEGVRELGKKYNAFVFRMEPDIKKDDKEFREIIEKIGYKVKDDAKDFKDEIQPRFVFRLDIKGKTEDEILAGCHQKTRYNIRLAKRKGVEIREGNREDLKDFHKIMIETGSRDGFIIRSLEYFEKMYDELAPKHMKVLMAYYDGKPISGIDFRGVSGVVDESHPQYGLYRFKKGFGAEFTEFIGEVYLPFKPLTYKLYKFAEKTFRTLRDWKRRIKKHKK